MLETLRSPAACPELRRVLRVCPGTACARGWCAAQIKVLKGLDESLARFYVGSIVLALEYLHDHNIGQPLASGPYFFAAGWRAEHRPREALLLPQAAAAAPRACVHAGGEPGPCAP